jgi:hypothetical protein
MIFLTVIILFLASALCFGLSRRVATRRLGLLAAAASLLGAVLLGLPLELAVPPLVTMDAAGITLSLATSMAQAQTGTALLATLASAACLLSLALALSPTVRGFGSIFGWALIGLAMLPLGLAAPVGSPVLVGVWSVAVIASYAAYRASGALQQSDGTPIGVGSGLFAGLVLLSGLLGEGPLAAGAVLVASMLLAGAAPFHASLHEARAVPAPLGALFYAIVLPTLAFGPLLEGFDSLPIDPGLKGALLLAVGSLGGLACAAGMLRERSLRNLLAWAASLQASLAIAALGLHNDNETMSLAVRGLLANLALCGAIGATVVTALEQVTGSDDYAAQRPAAQLRGAGLLWLVAMASVVGLPPFWGMWPRYWLVAGALAYHSWAVPLLVAGSVLALYAGLLPLATFWSQQPAPASQPPSVRSPLFGGLAAAIILVGLGLAPQLTVFLWNIDLATGVVASSPWLASPITAGLLLLLGLLFRQGHWGRTVANDAEMLPTSMAAEQLGSRLRPLAGVGHPQGLLALLWRALIWLSEQLQRVMNLFEQRYYLIGVLLTLVLIMFLMAQ